MDNELDLVTGWLLCASSQVSSDYFQLPVAGKEEPEYRERVYSYELYHRWRCHWPHDFRFSLSGEVDKLGNPLFRNQPKPDFLVHIPGQMTNLLIVEVKRQNADVDKMVKDLEKLTVFRRDYNYHAAYFWIYGLAASEWPQLRDKIKAKVLGEDKVDLSLITCFIHERAGIEATPVDWFGSSAQPNA